MCIKPLYDKTHPGVPLTHRMLLPLSEILLPEESPRSDVTCQCVTAVLPEQMGWICLLNAHKLKGSQENRLGSISTASPSVSLSPQKHTHTHTHSSTSNCHREMCRPLGSRNLSRKHKTLLFNRTNQVCKEQDLSNSVSH